jgi:hypothetical protein
MAILGKGWFGVVLRARSVGGVLGRFEVLYARVH